MLSLRKDVALSLTMLAFVPAILAIVIFIGKKIDGIWEVSDKFVDRQNEIMRERLRGIRVIRAFNSEKREHERVSEATRIMASSFIRGNVAMGAISPLATFLLNVAAVLIVYLGGWRMETSTGLTGGDIFAIVQYVSLVSAGVVTGAFAIISFPQAEVAAKRIGQVLHAKGMADPVERQNIKLSGDIDFDHVTFRYSRTSAKPVLSDIDLSIKSGETIGIIGGTGSSKSSLVNLISRLYDVSEGRVLVGGKDVRSYDLDTLRNEVSVVLQNNVLFSGTIYENLRWGDEHATDEECRHACELACADEFIERFPDGYNTYIEQGGTNVSGGQKQRLCIARALLKKPKILILDDSTSAVDTATDAKIRRAFLTEIPNTTKLIIAQRISSVQDADRIIVLDNGELNGFGTHEELLQTNAIYRDVYESQTGGGGDFDEGGAA